MQMIEDLKPYSQYKNSGLPWLGHVPAHWEIARGRQLFEIRKRIAGTLGYPVLSVTQQGLRVKDVLKGEGQISQDYTKYQLVEPGELAMNAMDLITGGVGIAVHEGVTSPDYRVLAIRNKEQHNSRFYLLLFRMLYANLAFYSCGQGSAQLGRWRLPRKRFNDFFFPTPPGSEQASIARFLAWATNRLDRAIGAKRRIITLLQEQKQTIIHRAVTRGLDPSVPLKDSGIPWLGEIPEHWEVLALKRVLSRLVDCEHKTAPFVQQSNYRVVRTSAVRNGLLRWSGTYCTSAKAYTEWTQRAVPEAGDVIFTREAPAGEACIIPEDARVCLGQRTVLMKPQRGIYDSQFLVHMIYAGPPRQLIELTCQGSTVSHFNMDDIGWMKILAPPLSEQIEIVAKVTELTEAPSLVIVKTEREITFLREYRTRLIADVVTGKLDVREMAAGLPEPQNVKDEQLEPEDEEPEFEAEDVETESMD
jgi:type I restriction enzyme S subunit